MATGEHAPRSAAGAALACRLRSWARRSAPAAVVVAIVAGALSSLVLAIAAGAARTGSAPDRYESAYQRGADLVVTQDGGRPMVDAVGALPSVARVRPATFVFVAGTQPGTDHLIDAITFAGDPAGIGARLVDGRLPDPATTAEFAATRSALAVSGLALGDTVTFLSITPDDLATYGFGAAPANGPTWDAELVGVLTVPSELDEPSPTLLFGPAAAADDRIATSGSMLAIELAAGATQADLRTQLDRIPGGSTLSVEPAATVSAEVRAAVRGQSVGLWVLAVLAAVATVVTIGYLLGRTMRVSDGERAGLIAIGYRPSQVVIESSARAGAVLALALVLAIVLSITASGWFPFGLAGDVEPAPGLRIEWVVLAAGAGFLLLAGMVWAALAARSSGSSPAVVVIGPAEPIARRLPSATAATGVRLAFTRHERTASFVAPVAGLTVAIAAFVAATTFGTSLNRLVRDPVRYGMTYDFVIDDGSETLPAEQLGLALDAPTVSSVERYRSTGGRLGDQTVPLMTSDSLRGDGAPVVLAGRLPVGEHEVALGGLTARRADARTGTRVAVSAGGPSVDLEVVGIVILPTVRGYDELGVGAYLDGPAFDALGAASAPESATVRLQPSADVDAVRSEVAARLGVDVDDLTVAAPASIANLDRIAFVPVALAALLFVMAAVTVAATLWSSVQRRLTLLVSLRAIGATGPWLRVTATWQAVAVMALPIAGGLATGLIAGRAAFRRVAVDRGVVPDPAMPVVPIALAIAALVLLAIVVSIVAGRTARVGPPSRRLHRE